MNLKKIIISETSGLISEIIGISFIQKLVKILYEESNFYNYKEERFLEFIEYIKTNEQVFTIELIKNECFISGLSLTVNNVIEQYSKQKRFKIYRIFKEFVIEQNKEEFELEKMYFMLNLLSLNDLEFLDKIDEYEREHEKITTSPEMQIEKPEVINSITSLQSLGILFSIPALNGTNIYQITNFGQKFRNYVFK